MQMSIGTTASWKGCTVYTASAKPKAGSSRMLEKRSYGSKSLFSVVPPTSGMFVWVKMHFENAPGYQPDEEPNTMELKLWVKIAEAGVLIGPGRYFSSDEESVDPVDGHFRIAFSYASVRVHPECPRGDRVPHAHG